LVSVIGKTHDIWKVFNLVLCPIDTGLCSSLQLKRL